MDAATLAHEMRAQAQPSDREPGNPPIAKATAVQPLLDSGRLRDIVLVRIATAGAVLARSDLSADLWPLVAHLASQAEWHNMLERDLGALADAGLCEVKPVAVVITAAGIKRAALVLGVNALPRTWTETKAIRLMARTLGVEALPPCRLKALTKADGLRAAVVQQAFKLKVRGVPTPAKLRVQLAALALSQAFGNSLPVGPDERSGLSAKAGRGLAGRLAHPPRAFPTDARLIAALAMEVAGASKADFASLQIALLRRYVTRGSVPRSAAAPKSAKSAKSARTAKSPRSPNAAGRAEIIGTAATPAKPVPPQLRVVTTAPQASVPSAVLATRPDFNGFVAAVRQAAQTQAEGWPGNRKAFVSRVWVTVQAAHPNWTVSAIEFKAMLTEAHRLGQIALANADLKDQHAIGELQASAIAYKNAIFHYVRVDD